MLGNKALFPLAVNLFSPYSKFVWEFPAKFLNKAKNDVLSWGIAPRRGVGRDFFSKARP
jgi:hypothetical protein